MASVKDKRVNPFRTICEVHRELYDFLIKEEKIDNETANKIIDFLEEAYLIGKKMNSKLRQYKFNYDDGWFEKSKEKIVKEKLKRRKNK